jgi:GNAT superfamily N-acetyltransferase
MSEHAYEIRKATEPDHAAVRACVEAAYTPYIEAIGVVPGPLGDDYAKRIADGCVWVAAAGGEIVGALVLVVEADHLLIDNYAVVPAWQNRGISRQLDRVAHREARRRGITSLRLYTHVKMTRNQAIYRSRGWVEVARRTEHGLERVYMERELRPDEGWEPASE